MNYIILLKQITYSNINFLTETQKLKTWIFIFIFFKYTSKCFQWSRVYWLIKSVLQYFVFCIYYQIFSNVIFLQLRSLFWLLIFLNTKSFVESFDMEIRYLSFSFKIKKLSSNKRSNKVHCIKYIVWVIWQVLLREISLITH